MGRTKQEAMALETGLRERLTTREYTALIRQLEGALTGIDLLRRRAPEFLDHFLAASQLLRTDNISDQTRTAIADLVEQLRDERDHLPPPPLQTRRSLRLIQT